VPEFVEPEKWPPNSPDFNAVDCSIWRALPKACLPSSSHSRRGAPERSPANLLAADWSRRYRSRYCSFANDCRLLLQPVEDTLSAALTNVLAGTRTLSHLGLHVLLQKYRTWTTKVNSPVYSAPPRMFLSVKYTGWAKKTGLFFRLDNFVTVSPRKACSMSKSSKFYREKKVQNSHFNEFKYSLSNLLKSSQHLKLCYI